MNILYIVSGFPPFVFSGTLRNAKLAYALQQEGHKLDIISRIDDIDRGYKTDKKWECIRENVYEIKNKKYPKYISIFKIILSSISLHTMPVRGIRWARLATNFSAKLIKKKKYDLIISRSPDDIVHLVAYRLHKKYKIQWIANWNDPSFTIWPKPYYFKKPFIVDYVYHHFEEKLLKGATINIFPSKELKEHFIRHFRSIGESQCAVISHIGLHNNLQGASTNSCSIYSKNSFRLCHSGNLSSERSPENLFTALNFLIHKKHYNISLDILGYINNYTNKLISKYNLEGYVNCIGSVSYFECIDLLQTYDALVLIEAKMDKGIFYASKITDYVQAKRPIIAVSPTLGFASNFISEHKCGILLNNEDTEEIIKGLKDIYKKWEDGILDKDYTFTTANKSCDASLVAKQYVAILDNYSLV